jgi:hypothetical protein
MTGIIQDIRDMDSLRKIDWALVIVMIAAFVHAGSVAKDMRDNSYKKTYTMAVEQCGMNPERVPPQFREDDCAGVYGGGAAVNISNSTLSALPGK